MHSSMKLHECLLLTKAFTPQGNKKNRLDGEEHMAVVEEFCMAAKDKWPNVLIQFEDFPTDKAFAILEKMRNKVLCFNGELSVHIYSPASGLQMKVLLACHSPRKNSSCRKCRCNVHLANF
jgi:hypothetical protein